MSFSLTLNRRVLYFIFVFVLISSVMTSASSTGYGPTHMSFVLSGDENKYELWEVRFLGHLKSLKLQAAILPGKEVDDEKNDGTFSELVQFLDDRSLSLSIKDAKNTSTKALQLLRNHYQGKGKRRIISLYIEPTSLKEEPGETLTAENYLKQAGEKVSDSLLVDMILKGLPQEYNTFITIVTQKEPVMSFSEFKVTLQS